VVNKELIYNNNMKIKNNKLVNEYVGMLMEVYGDGEVGLDELMVGVYGDVRGDVKDDYNMSVKKLKKDMFEMYNIKIGVNEDRESVYIEE
jgi:hypothetical protein